MRIPAKYVLVAVMIVLTMLSSHAGQAEAAVLNVNSTLDNALAGDGLCTLREAIMNANADSDVTIADCTAGSGADTINLPAGTYTLAIAGTGEDAALTGDLDITDDLTINGAGPGTTIIDGGALDRVFHILAGSTVDISGVTIQNGNIIDGDGGGILNSGTATLSNSIVTGNSAIGSFSGGGGVRNNDLGTMTIADSTVTANSAGHGGGILNATNIFASTTLIISNSTVSDNTATNGSLGGGGIRNGWPATLIITDSTISGNTTHSGGGIRSQGTLTIINSTISGNTGGAGGGLLILLGGPATILNSTISNNTSDFPGAGIRMLQGSSPTLKNTIIANFSPAGHCSEGSATSLGHNLDSDGTCNLTELTDVTSTDPLLGPLQDNGGPTETHALMPGSPAIDAGDDGAAPPTDQRGVARPQGAASDIGAYEFQPPACTLDLALSYGGGNLTLGLTLGSTVTTTLSMWLVNQSSFIPLATIALPPIDPPISRSPSFPFPQVGTIGVLAVMTTPTEGIVCGEWASGDTRSAVQAGVSVGDLRSLFGDLHIEPYHPLLSCCPDLKLRTSRQKARSVVGAHGLRPPPWVRRRSIQERRSLPDTLSGGTPCTTS